MSIGSIISLGISGIAIILSAISIFFQFFHWPRRIRLLTFPPGQGVALRFGICNSSRETIYVTGLAVSYILTDSTGVEMGHDAGQVQGRTAMIKPGEIAEYSAVADSPPDDFLARASPYQNANGGDEHTVGIKISIQLAFPDGTIVSSPQIVGRCGSSKNSSFFTVDDINVDLIKNATGVKSPT